MLLYHCRMPLQDTVASAFSRLLQQDGRGSFTQNYRVSHTITPALQLCAVGELVKAEQPQSCWTRQAREHTHRLAVGSRLLLPPRTVE
ncbi:hypothetical protein PsorP6_007216 [Peronosclerospora sorghi]|uniref:Uncharacterized protein n=1 Tax=Peronosclerospora sorghi TaxID=230839 RepID=A0ACC0W783_9STRA|nr:hypothetical protein PsorP6_007216 [Peronosclerospora sorghi]